MESPFFREELGIEHCNIWWSCFMWTRSKNDKQRLSAVNAFVATHVFKRANCRAHKQLNCDFNISCCVFWHVLTWCCCQKCTEILHQLLVFGQCLVAMAVFWLVKVLHHGWCICTWPPLSVLSCILANHLRGPCLTPSPQWVPEILETCRWYRIRNLYMCSVIQRHLQSMMDQFNWLCGSNEHKLTHMASAFFRWEHWGICWWQCG